MESSRPSVIASRFDIEELAGEGGGGAVYRAHDRVSGNTVAVKILTRGTREYDERFMREARALAELRHSAIVSYLDHGRTEAGVPYLAMEWLEGEDLQQRLGHSGMGVQEVVTMLTRVAEGLGAAHGRGMVHRDVKPSNIFLVNSDTSRVKLLDFGIAHMSGAAKALTRTGVLIGTPSYMAPEQARGDRDIDARADVFSLGCIAYRCLTGKRPFRADDIMAVAVKLLLEEPARVDELRPEVPRALADLVARMLSKAREDRPRDATAVANELATIKVTAGVSNVPPPTRSAPAPSSLTDSEQRLISVVVAEQRAVSGEETTVDRTIAEPSARRQRVAPLNLQQIAVQYGARIEQLQGGTVVATLSFHSGGTEEAVKAARVAMALRALLPQARLSLVTGQGLRSGKLPLGDALERAVALVREAAIKELAVGTIVLDEATAQMLQTRFEIASFAVGQVLIGERLRYEEEPPRLLGRPTQCVGRERELGTLAVTLDECIDEQSACAVILTAAPGMGKSRLLHEFIARARKRAPEMRVWFASGDAGSPGSPFAIVKRLLRSALGGEAMREEALREALLDRVSASVGEAEALRVAAFLGELMGLSRSDEEEHLLPRDSPVLMGDHIQRAFEDFISAECARQPTLLAIDDMQWGDGPSVRLIDGALRHLRDASLLVLAAGRPELDQAFPNLWSERAPLRMPIGPLSRKASESVVRGALPDAPAELVTGLAAKADGNALYLEELVRGHVAGRTDVPASVLLSVQARLDELDGGVRRVLRAASIFGGAFWRLGVLALIGGGEDTTLADDALGHLVERELVAARDKSRLPNQEEFVFRHALFREAAYATLTNADRTLGHRLAGAWLERAGERDAHVLAEHYERGEDNANAVRWLVEAAEDALASNDFAKVQSCVARARAAGAAGTLRGRLALAAAEADRWSGGGADQMLAHAEEAYMFLEVGSLEWLRAGSEVVHAARRLERIERCLEVVAEIDAEAKTPVPAVAEAMSVTATELMYDGKHVEAEALVRRLEEMSAASDDPLVQMQCHHAFSEKAALAGDLTESLRHETLALAASRERGDLRDLAQRRSNVAHGYTELGAYELAEAELRQAEAAAERLGLAHVQALVRLNLGWCYGRRGELAAARSLIEGSLHAFGRMGHTRLEAGALGYLAHVLLRAGEAAPAEAAMTRALSLDAPAGEYLFAYATRALARLALGKVDEALVDAQKAAELLDQQGGVVEGEVMVRLAHAESLFAAKQLDAARVVLSNARNVIERTAKGIGDEALRTSYLTRVPENVRVFDLVATWGV